MSTLLAYDWPCNVRELEIGIERYCAMNSGPVIHAADLPDSILGVSGHLANRVPETRIVPVADPEMQAIVGAIEKLNGDKLTAAKLLGIGTTTPYRKLKEYASIS